MDVRVVQKIDSILAASGNDVPPDDARPPKTDGVGPALKPMEFIVFDDELTFRSPLQVHAMPYGHTRYRADVDIGESVSSYGHVVSRSVCVDSTPTHVVDVAVLDRSVGNTTDIEAVVARIVNFTVLDRDMISTDPDTRSGGTPEFDPVNRDVVARHCHLSGTDPRSRWIRPIDRSISGCAIGIKRTIRKGPWTEVDYAGCGGESAVNRKL